MFRRERPACSTTTTLIAGLAGMAVRVPNQDTAVRWLGVVIVLGPWSMGAPSGSRCCGIGTRTALVCDTAAGSFPQSFNRGARNGRDREREP